MKVKLEKFIGGGQALGTLDDGRKIFVWGGLPGETVEVTMSAQKKSYVEGMVDNVIDASPDRVTPREAYYLATSPWQIVSETTEAGHKLDILRDQIARSRVEYSGTIDEMYTDDTMYGYRNKVEFGFTEQDDLLCLAVSERRSHEKIVVQGNALARAELNKAATDLLDVLRLSEVRADELSHLTLRCSQNGTTSACLVVRSLNFNEVSLPLSLDNLEVRFVDGLGRKHRTKILQKIGNGILEDELAGKVLSYGASSFFQVNVPVYEMALRDIRAAVAGRDVVELYAGVGSIGLTCGAKHVDLVDIDPLNTVFAKVNLKESGVDGRVVTSSSEKALTYISADRTLVVDPPRAGLSPQVVTQIMQVKPPQIVYLSCDPATLVRDVVKLQKMYAVSDIKVYNFFPRTPHIETLVVLELRA